MLVSEAVSILQRSELKQLAVKDDPDSILGFINLGVLEIYKKFSLWDAEAIIIMEEGKRKYTLDGSDGDVQIDLSDHDPLVIEEAYDKDGEPLSINDEKDIDGIMTPKFNQVEIAHPVDGEVISIVYRASPKFMTVNTQAIQLPSQFLEALFLFVGYKAQLSVKAGMQDNNNTYYARFVAACNLIKEQGLYIRDSLNSSKFVDRGFV